MATGDEPEFLQNATASETGTPDDHGPKSGPWRLGRVWRWLIGLLLVLLLAMGGALWFAHYNVTKPGPHDDPVIVLIPKGAGLVVASAVLDRAGLLEDPRYFQFYARYEKLRLRAGEFEIPARASVRDIVRVLATGKVISRKLTIAEGWSSQQVLAAIRDAPMLEGELPDEIPEGSVLPETYFYVYGDTRAQILARMQAAMTAALEDVWSRRPENFPLGTREELLTLASIVEKETGVAEERPMVAAVFLNRLRFPMRLQSDPTVIYGITRGAPLGRPILRSDLEAPTPYNTYVIDALPLGPIANPGRASLEAVINPAPSDALYFVADGTGGHVFARTLEEHNRNVARWRKIEREQRSQANGS